MFTLLGKIWEGITAIPGLILPFLSKASHPRGWKPWLKWTVHVLVMILILIGLGFLNHYFDLEKVVEAPWPFLRRIWLPLLFLLIYALAWLGWWLWELVDSDETASAYPDIDAAWQEAIFALDKAGIDLTETPVFLVLGKPVAGEDALFSAGQVPVQVRQQPRRPDSPLFVWGSRDAVYVTCAGASLLGRQAALLVEDRKPAAEPEEEPQAAPVEEPAVPKGGLLDWQAIPEAATPAPAAPPRKAKMGTLILAQEELDPTARAGRRRPSLLKEADQVELCTGRLRHLCNLIFQAREPYCPLNGILLLFPWAATDRDSDATQTGRICQYDLTVVRKTLRVNCPLFALVCDLEQGPGYSDIISRLPEKMRHLRMGLGFPLAPDLEATQVPTMIESGARWICDTLVPTLVYKLLRLDLSDPTLRQGSYQSNHRLYLLLYEMRRRQNRLAGMLSRACERDDHALPMLGGCYLGCTGRHPVNEQAFVTGVFPLLVDNQNFVSWTREAVAEDALFSRWTLFGYVGLAGLTVAFLILAYFFRPWH